jgi:hypothetical protein
LGLTGSVGYYSFGKILLAVLQYNPQRNARYLTVIREFAMYGASEHAVNLREWLMV